MKKYRSGLLVVSIGSAALVAACSTAPTPSAGTGGKTGSGGSSTGSGGSTTGSGGQVGTGMSVALTPSPSGFVDAATNTLGVIGAWYAYGDGYEGGMRPGKCQASGHTDAQCSNITMPTLPPGAAGFPPDASGAMCTMGKVAQVIAIPGMTALDYSNMYGAGIGLDLNNPGGANSVKSAFNAAMKGVTGISFDISAPPLALRVEFPTTADNPVAGADYWGATPTGSFPNSPVKAGTNTIHFATDVTTPMLIAADAGAHVFNASLVTSIQFHVPTTTAPGSSYNFCVSNLKLLTN
jgi:hypothetical protein